LASLAESIAEYWRQSLQAAADCPAEVFLLGANYDSAIQYPPFFEKYIRPGLAEFADMLHARGKYLLTHTDGENRGLLQQYVASRFDIADSVCPHPMTRLTIGEVRRAFDGRITIMGGIPSVALLKDCMNDRQFEQFLDEFFEQIGAGDHLILGVSDTTPPAAEFNRLLRIAERTELFGPT
jgi:uroporphyrinogen-III decarboxylase